MSQFTKNFEQFNREHPVMDDSTAELFTGAFPEAEHFSLGGSGDGPLPPLTEEKDGARVVALLTAGKTSKKTQSALAEALQSLLKSHSGLIAVDMDIFSPHSELLGTENEEGLTDHFLYGVSPENILRDSKRPGLKAITPGTFTPRTDEVYGNPRWKSLINWLSKETGRTVVLLGPPLERLGKFPALKYADTVVLLAEPLAQGQPPDDLQRILKTVSRNSAPGSALRMLWLGESAPKTEEPVEEEPEAAEPEAVEPGQAEPEAAEPETIEPVEEEPEAREPETIEPVEEEPEAKEPETIEPGQAEPEAEEPEAVEPGQVEPEAAEPETIEPGQAEPEAEEPEISGLDMLDETERIEIPDLEPAETLEGPGDLAGVEPDQAPDEKPKADSEVELEAPETLDLDTLDEAEQIKVPELEPAEGLEAPEVPAGGDLEPETAESPEAAPEAREKEAEPDSEPLKTIEKQPEPVEEAVPEQEAPVAESHAEEKEPEPVATEPSAEEAGSAAAGKPVEDLEFPEGEDEIFLPDELLFLDEDDKTGETGKSSQNNLDEEELTGLNYDALPDLKTMDEKAEELSEPAGKEDSAARDRAELVSAEAGAGDQEEEDLEMEEGEAEALYTQVEPEDEPPAEESHRTAAGPVDETRSAAAMEKMESFEKSLNAPQQEEARLEIDTDPLAEEESRPEGPETGEPVEAAAEAGPAGEEAPEDEAAPELDLEELESIEEAEPEPPEAEAGPAGEEAPEDEAAPELDLEELEPIEEAEPEPAEDEAEPAGEEAPEAEAAPELDMEELEPAGEAEPEPAEAEAGPAGEEAPEDETAPELDMEELEPAGEAEPEPAVAEAEPAADAEEPVEAEDEDSTIETLEDQEIAELEEGAEEPPTEELVELEDTGEEADEELAGEDLLGDEGDLGEDDLDIDLGTLEGEEEVKPVGKKKPRKKSKARPLVLLVIFLSLMGGMFYVWQQGIVSQLVRDHFPDLAGLLGIPTATLTEQVMSKEDERIATEKAQKAEEMAQREIEKQKYPMLSYSIQLGSFRFMDLANRARDQLAEKGLKDAYVVPLQLDSLGDWNRLYLGFYSSEAAADTARARAAKALGKFAGSAIVRQTPYALLVGEYSSVEAADVECRHLAESNIPSYSVPIRPDPSASSRYRLFVGAFENMDQAIIMRTLLFNLGLNAEITERRGGVKETGPPAA